MPQLHRIYLGCTRRAATAGRAQTTCSTTVARRAPTDWARRIASLFAGLLAAAAGRRVISACGALVAAATLSFTAAPAANADAYCPAGYACVWNQEGYNGAKRLFGAGDAGRTIRFDQPKLSFQNHFWNRNVKLWSGSRSYCVGSPTHLPYLWTGWRFPVTAITIGC